MQVCTLSVLLVAVSWILPSACVSRETLELTHVREENIFNLTCRGMEDDKNTAATARVRFWINETYSHIISYNFSDTVMFELKPQLEGTIFCDRMDGKFSKGLGPFAANPHFYAENNDTSNTTNIRLGKNMTLVCPIQLGVLSQAYSVLWQFTDGNSVTFELHNNTIITDDFLPAVTIHNVQKEDLGAYKCTVNVTNPYDGMIWALSSTVYVQKQLDEVITIIGIMVPLFALAAIAIVTSIILTRIRTSRLSKTYLLSHIHGRNQTKRSAITNAKSHGAATVPEPNVYVNPIVVPAKSEPLYEPLKEPERPEDATKLRETSASNGDKSASSSVGLKIHKNQSDVEQPHLNLENSSDGDDLCIITNIGNGNFGSVWKVTYKTRTCAAKLLSHHAQEIMTCGLFPATVGGIPSEALKSFKRECTLLEKYKHKNIVGHFATLTDRTSNLPILVMELLDCTLKAYLESEEEMKQSMLCHISFCRDISRGLEFLHSHDIIHRDLCDVNILLARQEEGEVPRAKVADLGMARSFRQDYKMTGLQREVYIPPEARENPSYYSHSVDIYSFGVIAIQVINVQTRLVNSKVGELFDAISDDHFLKSTIHSCISLDHQERPKASELVKKMSSSY